VCAQVDFGVDALHLGDVPDVLPALQKQQGNLAYSCDASAVPTTSTFSAILKHFYAANVFMKVRPPSRARLCCCCVGGAKRRQLHVLVVLRCQRHVPLDAHGCTAVCTHL
jgi:hypothetical protein